MSDCKGSLKPGGMTRYDLVTSRSRRARAKIEKEVRLRKKHPELQELWEKYQIMVTLLDDETNA